MMRAVAGGLWLLKARVLGVVFVAENVGFRLGFKHRAECYRKPGS